MEPCCCCSTLCTGHAACQHDGQGGLLAQRPSSRWHSAVSWQPLCCRTLTSASCAGQDPEAVHGGLLIKGAMVLQPQRYLE